METFKTKVPKAHLRFCVRHLYANFNKLLKGLELKKLLWKAATAYTLVGWEDAMKELEEKSLEAHKWLIEVGKVQGEEPDKVWSRPHFSTEPKCDLLCNNICESWNNTYWR